MANIKKIKLNAFKFQPFSKKQMQLLTWWQEDSPVSDRFICVADGSIRAGKEQSVKSKLYTPDGFKLMGEIKKGDYVFNRKGKPVRVLDIFPQGVKDVYRVTFNDGSSCLCGKEHLWGVYKYSTYNHGNKHIFCVDTDELICSLGEERRIPKYLFPLNDCVQFNSSPVLIDAYLLGLLLGDGCTTSTNISVTNTESDILGFCMGLTKDYNLDKNISRIKFTGKFNRELKKQLAEYGLLGVHGDKKFIPSCYKYNSVNVRLLILAGILNTDGCAKKCRPTIRYSSTSKQLVCDVIEVARSLGMYVIDNGVKHFDNKNWKDSYMCTVRVSKDLYGLLSDKHRKKLSFEQRPREFRTIKSIEYAGKDECQCILVDDDEHLYLTDDFIVTHNTVAMITSFALYVMTHFEQQNAAICGKSIGTLKRNVVNPLKQICETIGYEVIEHRSENFLEIRDGDKVNFVYLFGGKLLATL